MAFAIPVHAQMTAEKRVEIDTMLKLTGMEKLMEQMKGQMFQAMKSNAPETSVAMWDRLSARMDVREVIEKLMPIYDKYYSLEDLRAVNAFYSSPAGPKILSTLPLVMKDAMKVGQEWGEAIGREAAAEIAAEAASKTK